MKLPCRLGSGTPSVTVVSLQARVHHRVAEPLLHSNRVMTHSRLSRPQRFAGSRTKSRWKTQRQRTNYIPPGRTSSAKAVWTHTLPCHISSCWYCCEEVIDVIEQHEDNEGRGKGVFKKKSIAGPDFLFLLKWRHQRRRPSFTHVL